MAMVCSWAIRIFIAVYVVALLLFLVGTFGWFGSNSGPLAGVFLAPLGLPWNQLTGWAPPSLQPWLAAAAPVINILILKAICSRLPG